jgi:hypothetical protein
MWIPCPKCKSAVCITQWGEQTCIYEKCDGHKFTFEFNPETALLILEQIQKANIQERDKPKALLMRPSMPRLQKVTTVICWFTNQIQRILTIGMTPTHLNQRNEDARNPSIHQSRFGVF